MNPREKGWLEKYLKSRQQLFINIRGGSHRASHPDFSVYSILQPAGLMYGQPVIPLELVDSNWSMRDRLKVLLAESIICSSLLHESESDVASVQISDALNKTLEHINAYYQQVFPELAASPRTLLGRKKSQHELAEEIFEKRVEKMDLKGPFWVRFFHSSLLFLDVYIFGQWTHMHADKVVSEYFHFERDQLRTSVVRVMAAAAHANRNLAFEERKLLEYFLQSAGLTPEQKKECREIFEHGIAVEDLQLHVGNSWLLKKYLLEIAILTFWADKQVEETEMDVLDRMATILSLHREDVDNSLLAVEGFVLENWAELDTLQDKKGFEEVSVQFIQRMSALALRNRHMLVTEARSDSSLFDVLVRAQSSEVDEADKEMMRQRLVELLKRIPLLGTISLPQHFLTLPVMMEILPKDFIPEVLGT